MSAYAKKRGKGKRCPLCGGEVDRYFTALCYHFVCKECGLDACFYGAEQDEKESIRRWEKRTVNHTIRLARVPFSASYVAVCASCGEPLTTDATTCEKCGAEIDWTDL